jgi:hypothetical protein
MRRKIQFNFWQKQVFHSSNQRFFFLNLNSVDSYIYPHITLHCTRNLTQIFPEVKLRNLVLNFCKRFIYSQKSFRLFCCKAFADWSWEYINRSQIHECRKWETWPRSFISGNICFEFSVRSAFAVCSALIHSKINSLAPFLFSSFLNMIYNVVVLHSLNRCIKLHTLNMHESRTWLHDQNIEVPLKTHISAISSWSGQIWWEMDDTCMKKLSQMNSREAEFMNVQFRWGLGHSLAFSAWEFCMEWGMVFYQVFLLSPLQCTVTELSEL